jgi:signal transduction histidine kinase
MTAEAATTPPSAFQVPTQLFELAVVLVVLVVLVRRWREHRTPATGWAIVMFGVLGAILAAGLAQVKDDGSLARHSFTVALVSLLLVVPYALVRFAYALGAVGRQSARLAGALTVVQVVATLVSPRFPQPEEPRTTWFSVYVAVVIISWTVQSVIAAVGLWRAGNNQSAVIRRRMRSLAAGAVVVALALISSGGSSASTATQVVSALVGVVGICLLVLAFVVPAWLRAAWRAQDLLDLAAAERGLMTALTPAEVGATILPAMLPLFGARSAYFVDVPESSGPLVTALPLIRSQLQGADPDAVVVVTAEGVHGCRLSEGWLVVEAGQLAPVFGPGELLLLERVGTFVDLALQRCRLWDQEARSRRAAEAANAELQTLVYSVSHDLRNPIISVLGYLDVLAQEHAGELTGDGTHYLERISVNAQYMQSLIQDLLELSRIGRSEPPPQAVGLGDLVESVVREIRVQNPGCTIEVEGSYPVLWMSELRARQLLTNLVDNAAKHGGAQAQVQVRCDRGPKGEALVTVADNGPGIAPHLRDKAFEVFERLDAARSDIPGTGMGLPICKRIVDALGGRIEIDDPSDWTTTGATVRITVPLSAVTGWPTSPLTREKENAP